MHIFQINIGKIDTKTPFTTSEPTGAPSVGVFRKIIVRKKLDRGVIWGPLEGIRGFVSGEMFMITGLGAIWIFLAIPPFIIPFSQRSHLSTNRSVG